MSGLRLLAELLQPIENVTPYGGRNRSYQPLGVVWIRTSGLRRRERTDGPTTRSTEAMTVQTRTDPRLTEGRILRFDGGDWAVTGLQGVNGRPGRVELMLERGR